MKNNLIEELKKIPDFRTNEGRRHPLWFVLLIVIMGTMSGYFGYRALGDFVTKHRSALITTLKIPKNRVPSYSTIRRVIMGVDFEAFLTVFNNWAIAQLPPQQQQWLAVDGKTICGSITPHRYYSRFIQMASVYSTSTGLIVGMTTWLSTDKNEVLMVQNLLKALKLEGAVFTFDALHCQKKLSN